MTITATVIADSISPAGKRITTMQLRYPRFIHAEFMTHRMFSRNASSSRAIPVQRMIEDLRRDPAMPVFWGSNKPGMQAGTELDENGIELMKHEWIPAMEEMIFRAENMVKAGLHKQIANRILEPWAHINVVVTATDWNNFFTLRRHPDAQPEIKVLADKMYEAIQESTPQLHQPGEWHLPYVKPKDIVNIHDMITLGGVARIEPTLEQINEKALKVSVARCARVSYLTHDGRETTTEEDIALHDKLVVAQPLHASPAEHQATPDIWFDNIIEENRINRWANPNFHGNLVGWIQYRKTLPGENIEG